MGNAQHHHIWNTGTLPNGQVERVNIKYLYGWYLQILQILMSLKLCWNGTYVEISSTIQNTGNDF